MQLNLPDYESITGMWHIQEQSPDIVSTTTYGVFGMPIKTRTNAARLYKFAFNGQMKDDEIYGEGNTYSAQFWEYDARLGRRWNLDPKPQISISDYAVMGNNPIANVDPEGDIVKHNSVRDKINTTISRIINKSFRQDYKTLKNSEETYVFKGIKKEMQKKGIGGEFNYEGYNEKYKADALFINYNFGEAPKFEGESRFSSLWHESRHGVQFENGKIGFQKIGDKWIPTNYDQTDEFDAVSAGFGKKEKSKFYNDSYNAGGKTINYKEVTNAYRWFNSNNEQRKEFVSNTYYDLPNTSLVNKVSERTLNKYFFQRQYKGPQLPELQKEIVPIPTEGQPSWNIEY